jgi:hypothetical protein
MALEQLETMAPSLDVVIFTSVEILMTQIPERAMLLNHSIIQDQVY